MISVILEGLRAAEQTINSTEDCAEGSELRELYDGCTICCDAQGQDSTSDGCDELQSFLQPFINLCDLKSEMVVGSTFTTTQTTSDRDGHLSTLTNTLTTSITSHLTSTNGPANTGVPSISVSSVSPSTSAPSQCESA